MCSTSNPTSSYDFFKSELLKTSYFEDNIISHFTASFAAVRFSHYLLSWKKLLMKRV